MKRSKAELRCIMDGWVGTRMMNMMMMMGARRKMRMMRMRMRRRGESMSMRINEVQEETGTQQGPKSRGCPSEPLVMPRF
eukprot:62234-Pyramimonas_sp.AAC.1